MRVSLFAILPIALALASTVTAYYDDDFEARDYIDDLATRDYGLGDDILGARNLLVDISTRDLVEELTRRASSSTRWWCSCGRATFSKEPMLHDPAHPELGNPGHRLYILRQRI
ncbi:hypothetical protein D9611_008007 [Ephemerocybe angulata]|uniref:Uncharacterized protein n=1 Tax=Ephemerocybe angulata TaxID=980116 RepID=A0A8H5BZ94_9AGAR|nr:hypothetical protein D9611_008007 [Tulosesus angulatus]